MSPYFLNVTVCLIILSDIAFIVCRKTQWVNGPHYIVWKWARELGLSSWSQGFKINLTREILWKTDLPIFNVVFRHFLVQKICKVGFGLNTWLLIRKRLFKWTGFLLWARCSKLKWRCLVYWPMHLIIIYIQVLCLSSMWKSYLLIIVIFRRHF